MTENPLQYVEFDRRGDLLLKVGTERGGNTTERSFLVCSNCIARVSPVFDRMLFGAMKESKLKWQESEKKEWVVDLPEDDPDIFELFLSLCHADFNKIPRALPVDKLYDLTKLTHYYDMTQLLVPWMHGWMMSVRDTSPEPDITMVPQLLFISWELGNVNMVVHCAQRLLMESPGSMLTPDSSVYELQLPSDIIERIAAIRIQTIQSLLNIIRDMVGRLIIVDEGPRWCQHASFMGPHRCESMILGSLTFCLARAGLWPLPEDDEVEMTILQLHKVLVNLIIHNIGTTTKSDEPDHSQCNPKEYMMSRLRETMMEISIPITDVQRKQIAEQLKGITS
ncbi:hypothetical protein NUW58_g1721 [Xylaria curta]|uniref:Uncharacterized protein n=2 Tax=Xylaria curta TaxID=42375 RepID=A0ACC1PLU2_9PEZI|nr:hypothetical protein NUW58_g8260 [Xylaria curta]KAJ2993856.1 hypothetical protein NUW58_g1721 [Xylaria curta]